MKNLKRLTILLLVLLVACSDQQGLSQAIAKILPSPAPVDGEIQIDSGKQLQAIEGFGASGAWWAQDVGGWNDDSRERIIKLLFDQEEGIGLSIYRYNIGGGDGEDIPDSWRRAETFEIARGEYDWSRDANAIWVLKAAQQAGVEHFVAFANSPTARMTYSGRTNGDEEQPSNLPEEMYPQFAQYLVDVVQHLQEDEGIPIGWLSPINEPQWEWLTKNGQEGCHYTPDEVAGMTKALIQTVQDNNLDVKISAFESGEWKDSSNYIERLLSDSEIAPYLDHLAIHSYWSDGLDKERLIFYLDKHYPGIAIQTTEWTEMEQGRDTGMVSALLLANTIHEDLTIGRVISWQYWIAVSKYNFRDGLLYVALNDHEITETKRLWAMGNYSRFVRPGYQRVVAESSLPNLKTTAFESPDKTKLVVVVVHNGDQEVTIEINNSQTGFSLVFMYETSKENDLAEILSGAVTETFAFKPKSVTTLVYKK